ncbi:nuclear transport factor 2 family protein [Thalassomonas sp. RHCl1]|uniref:nuclear transport factor 2 family protein n=1 Tax=Thalassomonas sp. RHCl1 TaxID=2995320 RepID=UPI00248BDD9C|nr:nuclear transport factor 2 family protein [Thalassomonas sp. RHCl1]
MWKTITFSLLFLVSVTSFAQSVDKPTIDFQSLKKSSWSQQELKNAKQITDFVQNLMNDHNFGYVLEHFNDSSYIQHNRNIPDKIIGLVGFLQEFVDSYPEYSYDVKHIYVDGDFVIFHSHATLKKEDRGNDQKGLNIIDTWRIENGKIVEHWDSIQALDFFMRSYSLVSGGNIRNSNGVF